MAESQIFNALVLFFEEDGWDFQRVEGASVLSMGFSGKNGKWLCYAHAREEEAQFAFYSVLSINVPADKRHKVAEFITRANYGMMIGNFEMDYVDGEIRYKTSIDVEGTDLTSTMIQQLVYPNLIITDHYFEGIMRVVYSDDTPVDILDGIDFGGGISDEEVTAENFGDLTLYSDGSFSLDGLADDDFTEFEIDDFDDDDESYDDDDESGEDAEFLFAGRALRALRRRIKKKGYRRRRRKYRGLKHSFNQKRVKFKRGRFAQKSDLIKLRNANVSEHKSMRKAISRNASTIRKNVSMARKAVSDVKLLDKKHSKVAAAQTSMIKKLDKGLGKVKKDMTAAQQAQQQQQLFSMLLKPELETIDVTKTVDGNTRTETLEVSNAKYKNEMLPMLFAFMGNQNGGSGGNGMNNMMLPLLLTMND